MRTDSALLDALDQMLRNGWAHGLYIAERSDHLIAVRSPIDRDWMADAQIEMLTEAQPDVRHLLNNMLDAYLRANGPERH